MEYGERRFGEVPWKMETGDHRSRRYHGKWRQEIIEAGGTMENGDKRS